MKLTKEQRKNLEHALMHLLDNRIAELCDYDGWFVGNKDYFIRRHKKAIKMLEDWLEESE